MHESREEELNKKKRNKKMISTQVIRVMLIWMRLGTKKNKEFQMKKNEQNFVSISFESKLFHSGCFFLYIFINDVRNVCFFNDFLNQRA